MWREPHGSLTSLARGFSHSFAMSKGPRRHATMVSIIGNVTDMEPFQLPARRKRELLHCAGSQAARQRQGLVPRCAFTPQQQRLLAVWPQLLTQPER